MRTSEGGRTNGFAAARRGAYLRRTLSHGGHHGEDSGLEVLHVIQGWRADDVENDAQLRLLVFVAWQIFQSLHAGPIVHVVAIERIVHASVRAGLKVGEGLAQVRQASRVRDCLRQRSEGVSRLRESG